LSKLQPNKEELIVAREANLKPEEMGRLYERSRAGCKQKSRFNEKSLRLSSASEIVLTF